MSSVFIPRRCGDDIFWYKCASSGAFFRGTSFYRNSPLLIYVADPENATHAIHGCHFTYIWRKICDIACDITVVLQHENAVVRATVWTIVYDMFRSIILRTETIITNYTVEDLKQQREDEYKQINDGSLKWLTGMMCMLDVYGIDKIMWLCARTRDRLCAACNVSVSGADDCGALSFYLRCRHLSSNGRVDNYALEQKFNEIINFRFEKWRDTVYYDILRHVYYVIDEDNDTFEKKVRQITDPSDEIMNVIKHRRPTDREFLKFMLELLMILNMQTHRIVVPPRFYELFNDMLPTYVAHVYILVFTNIHSNQTQNFHKMSSRQLGYILDTFLIRPVTQTPSGPPMWYASLNQDHQPLVNRIYNDCRYCKAVTN